MPCSSKTANAQHTGAHGLRHLEAALQRLPVVAQPATSPAGGPPSPPTPGGGGVADLARSHPSYEGRQAVVIKHSSGHFPAGPPQGLSAILPKESPCEAQCNVSQEQKKTHDNALPNAAEPLPSLVHSAGVVVCTKRPPMFTKTCGEYAMYRKTCNFSKPGRLLAALPLVHFRAFCANLVSLRLISPVFFGHLRPFSTVLRHFSGVISDQFGLFSVIILPFGVKWPRNGR